MAFQISILLEDTYHSGHVGGDGMLNAGGAGATLPRLMMMMMIITYEDDNGDDE